MKKIYLDYAATTPVDSAVFRAMKPYFSEKFGNPGSLHGFGQQGIAAVDASRATIAKAIGADFREIIFTSSATEANNLALRGVVSSIGYRQSGIANREEKNRYPIPDTRYPRIIISSIEHESVLETARELEKEGIEVVYIPVDRSGVVDLKKIKESLTENTVLVSVMYANNEIGTVQPISEIAKIVGDFRNGISNFQFPISKPIPDTRYPIPYLHIDASQAFQFLNCNVHDLGVDLMTLSAHKIYGPKGAGCLYVRGARNVGGVVNARSATITARASATIITLPPALSGGGQEFGLRSGTENVPAIVGFAKAVELIAHSRESENPRLEKLRNYLWRGIKKIDQKAEVNGISNQESGITNYAKMWNPQSAIVQLPNMLNIYFPNHDAQDLLTRFDLQGLAVSSGSACRSRAMESSYVIEALGYAKERAKSSIRFSLGRPTIKADIDGALKIVKKIIK